MTEPDAQQASSPLRFLLPAALGVVVFLGPVITEARQTVVFGVLTDAFKGQLGSAINEALLIVTGIAAIGALLFRLLLPAGPQDSLLDQMFRTSWLWIVLRLLGFGIVLSVYLDAGPVLLRLPDTGMTAVKDIGQNILVIYFIGLLLIPLLTEYGLMEFAGTLCRPLFARLFRLPGRAAIDSLTSVVAAAAIAFLVTVSQYQRGFYTAREACVIACNFSLVSIPFSLLIAEVAGIAHLFFGWYLAVLVACALAAMVLSRVPPLVRLPDETVAGVARPASAEAGGLAGAWQAALDRAATGPGPVDYLRQALRTFAVTATSIIGPSIAVASLAAITLFHTPVVTALTWPLAQLLALFGLADAPLIASGLLIGLGDQFLPALVAARLDSELWRFALAGLAVAQIIFMSEFGLLMLRSPLPVTLPMLVWLFLLRTLLTLPVLLVFAALLTG